jgi:hypothetical protein
MVAPVAMNPEINLYKSLNADGKIDEAIKFENVGNYLVVPANYDPSEATAFANLVNNAIDLEGFLAGSVAGIGVGITDMTVNFSLGGKQDLQRGSKWGVPYGDTAPAFKDTASWNLGFVMEQSNMPNVFAEIGGGLLNVGEFLTHPSNHKRPTGPFGMDPDDAKDFRAGVEAARLYGDHELALTHQNALAIGGSVHASIAPITHAHGRAGTPRTTADRTNNDDSLALNQFYLAQDLMAAAAAHAPPPLFHQIGEEVLTHTRVGTKADRPLPNAEFPIFDDQSENFDKLGQSVAPHVRHIDSAMAVHLPVGRELAGAPQHRPYIRDEELPSIAPIMLQKQKIGLHQNSSARLDHRETRGDTAKWEGASRDANHTSSQAQVKRALEALLNAQARMPPSGPTAFDPSLTPAWAGLKLA